MKKKFDKTSKAGKKKTKPLQPKPINIALGIIPLAYILIPTFTPNLMAFDSNAPKFLALAFINLLAFVILIISKQIKQKPDLLTFFFKTGVGLVYVGFLLVSLLSFLNAHNLLESFLQITKVFTVFTAVYILAVIIKYDFRYIKWIIIMITLMLIFDSLSVFYFINEFIQGRVESIIDIKSIYSNKNIMASAIFIKVPVAIWLLAFGKGRLRWLGWFGLLVGATATLFMAARVFYVGLILISILFLLYMLVTYLHSKTKSKLRLSGYFLVALVLAYLSYTGTQQFLYPKNKINRLTQGITQQLATISTSESSLKARFDAWEWSWLLLKEKPLLGVGSGNWKVEALKFQNSRQADSGYFVKAHNDFIETTTETGFIGGLIYLSIFVMVVWAFLKKLISGKYKEDSLFQYLFLAVLGIICYSIDAFFNFPADRPEVLVLFSFYMGTAIAVIGHYKKKSDEKASPKKIRKSNNYLFRFIVAMAIILMAGCFYITILNFESSKTQRIVYQEIKLGNLRSSSDKIIAGYPFIPNITGYGEPIKAQIARYFLDEGRNEEAIALLRTDRSNPWHGKREYFMAMGFHNLNQIDSALVYQEKLCKLKPNYYRYIILACNMLDQRKEYDKVANYLDTYLSENKENNEAWIYATNFYMRIGELNKAWDLIEEARNYLPGDTLVAKQHYNINHKKFVEPYSEHVNKALEYFNKKDFRSALAEINKFIDNVPNLFTAHQIRAKIYYYLNDYRKCIDEVNYAITLSEGTGEIFNLRGSCYLALKDMDNACKDFAKALELGDKKAITNYNLYCKEPKL